MAYKQEDAGNPARACSVSAEKPANRPVKSYRCGNFSGAIWANEKDTTEGSISFLTASLRRSWKDKSGSWRDERVNLRKNDVAKAIVLLNRLQEDMFFSEAEENE